MQPNPQHLHVLVYKTRSVHSRSVNRPAASVASTVKSYIPAALEIPLITPTDESVMPSGSPPSHSEKRTRGVPRIVVNFCLYFTPRAASGNCAGDVKYGCEKFFPTKSAL